MKFKFEELLIINMKKIFIIFFIIFFSTNLYGESLVENFENQPENRWQFFTDGVMGGKSSGKLDFWKDGETTFARMIGKVTTKNNGGFIQFRGQIAGSLDNNMKGIKIVARGNNQKYYIHLRTSGTILPWQYFSQSFDVKNNWTEIVLPFTQFKASGTFMRRKIKPSSIRSVGIVAFGREHKAEIEVSEIIFF